MYRLCFITYRGEMAMTKTRLKIVEIIKEYMDKTFSEGCVAIYKDTWRYLKLLNTLKDSFVIKWDIDVHFIGKDTWYEDEIEIIGHYDMTAVIKYIDKFDFWPLWWCWQEFSLYFDTRGTEIWHEWSEEGKYIFIPNKPLHLYTEEEDEKLLSLLQKLW